LQLERDRSSDETRLDSILRELKSIEESLSKMQVFDFITHSTKEQEKKTENWQSYEN
jgi:hypothetical protein